MPTRAAERDAEPVSVLRSGRVERVRFGVNDKEGMTNGARAVTQHRLELPCLCPEFPWCLS